MLLLLLAIFVFAPPAISCSEDLALRPWHEEDVGSSLLPSRTAQAQDSESTLEVVRWCLDQGLFVEAEAMIAELLATDASDAATLSVAGLKNQEGKLQFEELERYSSQGEGWALPAISATQRKKLLGEVPV